MNREAHIVEVERRLDGSPEEAFTYFTDPAKHVHWQGISADIDPRPGGDYVIHMSAGVRVRGRFLEIDAPYRIVLAWGVEADPNAVVPPIAVPIEPESTIVEISFVPEGNGTIVRVIHSGLPDGAAVNFTSLGWSAFMDRLAAVAAGLETGPDPFSVFIENRP